MKMTEVRYVKTATPNHITGVTPTVVIFTRIETTKQTRETEIKRYHGYAQARSHGTNQKKPNVSSSSYTDVAQILIKRTVIPRGRDLFLQQVLWELILQVRPLSLPLFRIDVLVDPQ